MRVLGIARQFALDGTVFQDRAQHRHGNRSHGGDKGPAGIEDQWCRDRERGKPGIAESAQVDYIFHRMFAMIRLLLKSSNRGG